MYNIVCFSLFYCLKIQNVYVSSLSVCAYVRACGKNEMFTYKECIFYAHLFGILYAIILTSAISFFSFL